MITPGESLFWTVPLWDYQEVLNVHENLEYVNESINKLDLVAVGF